MKNIEDLGRKWKDKYPEDAHLSDREAGQKCKAKHPFSYLDYQDNSEALAVVENQDLVAPCVEEVSPILQTQIAQLQNYYNPNQGRISSWFRRTKSESRLKLLNALGAEAAAVISQAHMLEEAARESQRAKIEFNTFIAENQVVMVQLKSIFVRTEQATALGLPLDAFTNHLVDQLAKQREIDFKKALNDLDLDKLSREYSINHDNISRTQQEKLELIDRATARLDRMYDRRTELLNSNDPEKASKLARLEKNIQAAERDIDEQAGLVQDETGEVSDGYATPDDGGRGIEEEDTPGVN